MQASLEAVAASVDAPRQGNITLAFVDEHGSTIDVTLPILEPDTSDVT